MPSPRTEEERNNFISRCMSSEEAQKSFPDQKQRTAFCHSQWKSKGVFVYRDPKTRELHYFENRGIHRKGGRTLIFVKEQSMSKDHIINEVDEAYRESLSDERAGYPPNCNPGYVEKDGKCVPEKEEE